MVLLEGDGGDGEGRGARGGDDGDDVVLGSQQGWPEIEGSKLLASPLRARDDGDGGAMYVQRDGGDGGGAGARWDVQLLRVCSHESLECIFPQHPSLLVIFVRSSCRLSSLLLS